MAFRNTQSSEMKEVSDHLSLLQIKYECETIKSIVQCFQCKGGSIIALGIMPYIALSAYSALEYLHNHGYRDQLKYDTKTIADLRLKLKLFENGYSKTRKMILNIDYLQDQIFRRQYTHDYIHKSNDYYNLGVYTDTHQRVLYNTQYAYYAMQDDAFIKRSIASVREDYENTPEKFDLAGKIAYEYSYKCGQVIGAVGKKLMNFDSPVTIMAEKCDKDIFYADYNTNKRSTLFPDGEEGKALQLYLLHTLSTINYVLYAISIYEKDDFGWWLKISYIAFYYAHRKLRDLRDFLIKNDLLTNDLIELIESSNIDEMNYINVNFRNYLMHADLVDKQGKSLIEIDKLDRAKPYFGLIESCFEGISYNELKKIIHDKLLIISEALASCLRTSELAIKPLD